ncbi:uncharacterized protein LOC128674886 [Plodia interpunctella]|uniref:uncharacterized protein LOC128674886 n=1 Tax=Plodia interpunctella TaxID=58824 RepID=UPI0023683385|nr:uncharacterized protein LOC128674886 [Plodia interpunctella]
MIWLFTLLCIFGIVQGLEVIPEKPEVEYINHKYIKNMKFTIQRKGRGSPYYIHFYVETLSGCGNNLTITMKLYEYIGGNYLPTGIQGEYKICDFLEHEPYLGKMFNIQVQQRLNASCPFKAGSYQIKDLVIDLENFPFNIPFTWSSISVRTRSDVTGHLTETKEPVFRYNFQFTITQKPRNKII